MLADRPSGTDTSFRLSRRDVRHSAGRTHCDRDHDQPVNSFESTERGMKAPLISLIPLVLVGCATVPPHPRADGPANQKDAALIDLSHTGSMPLGTVAVDVDGTLPAQSSTDARLAGRVSLSATESLS